MCSNPIEMTPIPTNRYVFESYRNETNSTQQVCVRIFNASFLQKEINTASHSDREDAWSYDGQNSSTESSCERTHAHLNDTHLPNQLGRTNAFLHSNSPRDINFVVLFSQKHWSLLSRLYFLLNHSRDLANIHTYLECFLRASGLCEILCLLLHSLVVIPSTFQGVEEQSSFLPQEGLASSGTEGRETDRRRLIDSVWAQNERPWSSVSLLSQKPHFRFRWQTWSQLRNMSAAQATTREKGVGLCTLCRCHSVTWSDIKPSE